MAKYLVLLCLLCAFVHGKSINPKSAAEDAQKELQNLRSIVTGEILAASIANDDTEQDYYTFADKVYIETRASFQLQEDTITSDLNGIQDLADSNAKNISTCLNATTQEIFSNLTLGYRAKVVADIGDISAQVKSLRADVDDMIELNNVKVDKLEDDVKFCKNDTLCLIPIIQQIELNKVRLPQNIKTEVDSLNTVVSKLKLDVQGIAEDNLAKYTAEAYGKLRQVTDCVDQIV